ncbi:MAG: exo-alpha-sialidase [Chloroflexi bacterium]|nr:exo-alpha-sialidase [Chloroflexota bacterium]
MYTSQSSNNGASWSEPTAVDGREITDPPASLSPSQLQIIARQGVIHRLWRAGHNDADGAADGQACALYHSWSSDNGQNWSARLRLLADIPQCVQSFSLFADADNAVWLMATTDTQTIVQVWGGSIWGQAQVQAPVTQFTDPQTFRAINLACQQPAINNEAELVVLGCGGTRGQDAWVLQRPLGELTEWLPQVNGEAQWQAPVVAQQDAAAMTQLSLVMDQENQPHLFWIQPQRRTVENDPGTVFYAEAAIYHAVRVNGTWVTGIPVVAAAEGDVEELAATVSPDDRLMVVWSNPQTGLLFFSQVNSQQALDPNQWSPPLPLPLPGVAATSPDIGVMADGTVVVAYTVPVNEKRGVYLTLSRDNGLSWAEPIEVFDAAAAAWAMLDQPHLAFTDNNHIHLTWRHLSPPPTSEPLALYYARSIDGGQSWGDATSVISGNVVWSDIVGWSTTQLHIVWRETQTGQSTLWHVPSADDGITLERPIRITTFEDLAGPTSLALDSLGQLHLFQLAQPVDSPLALLPFLWNEQSWLPEPELALSSNSMPDGPRLTSTVGNQGETIVAFAGPTETQREEAIWVSAQISEQPLALPTPLPSLTPTPMPTSTSVPTPTPTAEPTVDFPKEPETANNPTIGPMTINSTTDGIIIGVFLAASLVGIVFLWGLRASRSGK